MPGKRELYCQPIGYVLRIGCAVLDQYPIIILIQARNASKIITTLWNTPYFSNQLEKRFSPTSALAPAPRRKNYSSLGV